MKIKKNILAGILLSIFGAALFTFLILGDTVSLPWPDWVTYVLGAVYTAFTVLIFLSPKMSGFDFVTGCILAMQVAALSLIIISIGLRKSGTDNWYLPAGLSLTCLANLTNSHYKKKKDKEKSGKK